MFQFLGIFKYMSHNELTGSPHTVHIPVMGTGFTIDTPLKAARYGISSVVSLVDDLLIEQMRKFHSEKAGEPYEEIASQDPDARARRITTYLNLMDLLIHKQVQALQSSPFEPGSEITRYYELLPESDLKRTYQRMLAAVDVQEKSRLQESLRVRALPALMEMARWKAPAHAIPAFMLVGRIAGLGEQQLEDAWSRGDRESVIAAASKK